MTGKEIQVRKKIASQIQLALKNSGRNKADVCRGCGVQPETLNNILIGNLNYKIDSLSKVVVELDIDFLLMK